MSNVSTSGIGSSDPPNGDRPQKVPEVVKNIIMHDFGDTDEDEDSIKDLRTPHQGSPTHGNSLKFNNGASGESQLKLENSALRDSLYNAEEEVMRMKNERDNLAIKYNAINEKVISS